MNNQYKVPQLDTARCTLRMIDEIDASDLFEMRHDPKMIEFTDSKLDETIADTRAYIRKMIDGIHLGRWLLWVIIEKETNTCIGSISLWNFNEDKTCADLGYGIKTTYQHRGYMSEVLPAIETFAFEQFKLHKLQAYTEERNAPSCTLLEKCGYTYSNTLVESGYFSDKQFTMRIYEKGSH